MIEIFEVINPAYLVIGIIVFVLLIKTIKMTLKAIILVGFLLLVAAILLTHFPELMAYIPQ